MPRLAPAAILSLLAAAAFADEPALRAGALTGSIRVDGVLDEAEWAAADAIPALTMVEPREGEAASARTGVRVLASADAIVVGARCDAAPGSIVSFTRERDGDVLSADYFAIALDTFRDGRSGYIFVVNPGGARWDAIIDASGEDVNVSWDGIWEAATRRDESGWTVEMRIPIQTLSFKPGTTWGFNVERRLERFQELDRWASPLRDFGLTRMNRAGRLEGLPEFDLGLGLGIRPSVLAGFGSDAPGEPTKGRAEPSLDVTKRLGSNALASLTINTDFAETEVDTRQTNLTRFPLFFPEKRTFFLDGADIFEFGLGLGQTVAPFFSRRVGLVEEQEVAIGAGLKATGRAGGTNFGVLGVRTREGQDLAPASSLGVLRVRQNVLEESSLGMLATAGDPLGRAGAWTAGIDFTYKTSDFGEDKNFAVGVWGLANGRDDLRGRKAAFGLKVDYPNDLWDCVAIFRQIGDGFDPSLGFVPRTAVRFYLTGCAYQPRPGRFGIRQMFFELFPELVTDLEGRWESYSVGITPLHWQLESGDRILFNLVPQGERLSEPFEIEDGVVVPPAAYAFRRFQLDVETAAKRKLATEISWEFGGFYSGTLHSLTVDAALNPSPLATVILSVDYNVGRLDEGRFDTTLLGGKLRLNLSPNLQFNSFVQYDTESRSLGSNTRLRWTFHPAGELFVIYNHNLRRFDNRFSRESNELLVKAQYTFRR